jgi:hypothetical protein
MSSAATARLQQTALFLNVAVSETLMRLSPGDRRTADDNRYTFIDVTTFFSGMRLTL